MRQPSIRLVNAAWGVLGNIDIKQAACVRSHITDSGMRGKPTVDNLADQAISTAVLLSLSNSASLLLLGERHHQEVWSLEVPGCISG